MGTRFLVDTNIIIYHFKDEIPGKSTAKSDDIFDNSFNVSVISQIEFLGWPGFSEKEFQESRSFLSGANIIPVITAIAEKTIQLKRKRAMKLPDAVIAATCLIDDYTLFTRNVRDFDKISGLRFYNPFAVKKPKSK